MAKNTTQIGEKLQLIPEKPGIYRMYNSEGEIIYVGKAKVLRNRVRSYFTGAHDRKTTKLVSHITDFDYIITSSETEAFMLEANLIRKYKPHYNIMLKDDHRYPFIKITLSEPFPRVVVTREIARDGSRYFGPYTDTRAVRKTLRVLEWIFAFRTCKRIIPSGPPVFERACINYQMGKCQAPCIGKISTEKYRGVIRQIIDFLRGKNEQLIEEFSIEMKQAAKEMRYEDAARYRDRIQNIQKLNRSQNVYFPDLKDRDVLGMYKEGAKAAVSVLKVLSGKLLNREIYEMQAADEDTEASILSAFLTQYYANKLDALPNSILVQTEPDDIAEHRVVFGNRLAIPQRGENRALTLMARENAFNFVEEQKLKYLRKSSRTILPITQLKDRLGLKTLPRKMACFDISTIQGTDTVASMVYFENGKPKKKNYRHYIIETVVGQDDFASMKEALARFLAKPEENEIPDLIVIDGGKGQLSAAYQMVQESAMPSIAIISLAKRLEEIFLPGRSESIILPKSSPSLGLLIHLRDEAHRFAITFHRKRRSARTLTSELDGIKGIGEETKFLLLKEFGSVSNIRAASITELCGIKGIGVKTAQMIISKLPKK